MSGHKSFCLFFCTHTSTKGSNRVQYSSMFDCMSNNYVFHINSFVCYLLRGMRKHANAFLELDVYERTIKIRYVICINCTHNFCFLYSYIKYNSSFILITDLLLLDNCKIVFLHFILFA